MPAPPVPRMNAPASLIRRLMNPTSMPSVLPVMRPLLVSAVIEEVASPLMPRPLAEVMLPVLAIVLLPAPVKFTAALSPVPTSDVPPAMSPLLVRPMERALMPCRPPEISLLLIKRVIAPVLRMPVPFVEVMRPRLVSRPMTPRLLTPAPSLEEILARASFSSSVISPAATAASEPPSMRPRSRLRSWAIVLAP